MPKDKERSVNPAQQQRKLEKVKALKKGKAELQARRNEKLARRNPDRLQRQIDDLKALDQSGNIRPREKQILQELEKDLRAVKKARDALGEKAPEFGNKSGQAKEARIGGDRDKDNVLGKRKWNVERKPNWDRSQEHDSGSETDESVKRIPMPKDTPPPIPRRVKEGQGTSANAEPLASNRGGERLPNNIPSAYVVAQPKTTYESAPQIRDLRKEAIGRFVPNVVRQKQDTIKGVGRLAEAEELDKLEQEGYIAQKDEQDHNMPQQLASNLPSSLSSNNSISAVPRGDGDAEARRLAEEEERFRSEMKQVEIEEVQDEDV